MLNDIYKAQYDFELDQRAQLDSKTSIPIAVVAFLAGGLSALIMNYDFRSGSFSLVFSITVALAFLALISTIY